MPPEVEPSPRPRRRRPARPDRGRARAGSAGIMQRSSTRPPAASTAASAHRAQRGRESSRRRRCPRGAGRGSPPRASGRRPASPGSRASPSAVTPISTSLRSKQPRDRRCPRAHRPPTRSARDRAASSGSTRCRPARWERRDRRSPTASTPRGADAHGERGAPARHAQHLDAERRDQRAADRGDQRHAPDHAALGVDAQQPVSRGGRVDLVDALERRLECAGRAHGVAADRAERSPGGGRWRAAIRARSSPPRRGRPGGSERARQRASLLGQAREPLGESSVSIPGTSREAAGRATGDPAPA